MSDVEFCSLAQKGELGKLEQQLQDEKTLLTKTDQSQRMALHWAASGGQVEVVNYLLQQGAPLDVGDDMNWTPLHIASSVGQVDIVSALVEKGATVNAVNQTGQTPLHYAAFQKQVRVK
ncbi:proteasome (prosome, macropain) 26S subunit, non-ATPase, 10 [Apostichopus japonicus]|uniref:Proteasome (Prosome, macropain) 26S subunit, non-ATPase, 10 n=1 Tax=Stichopus japonicus TaxID=307972 RepID=A0A2G8KFJ1_STIJA|nr:proteasome (prosome, macropain) 26S subunit, non-ATPase, 10 [Apostichopus japonicus]